MHANPLQAKGEFLPLLLINDALNLMSFITQSVYGTMPNGEIVTRYDLGNSKGISVSIITFGGIITSVKTPDKHGNINNIVLGLDNLDQYIASRVCFGALVGRYANRIRNGTLTIDKQNFSLNKNNGKHHIHGGTSGFNRRNWHATAYSIKNKLGQAEVGVKMQLFSCDGDQGYPGNLMVVVDYKLTDDNQLITQYTAKTDKKTHINLTQHSYFNLEGQGDILNHQMKIFAGSINEIDHEQLPTGNIIPVDNSPFDFRAEKAIGDDIHQENQQLKLAQGYDHNFILDKPNNRLFDLAAKVYDPASGRRLRVYTEEPGLQFYTGNLLDSPQNRDSSHYQKWSGFCLEPQHFPDTPNNPHFPSTLLHPGEIFSTSMSYQFDTLQQ